jgi:hypothetical protein
MKQTGIILAIITAIMLLPAPVEYLARSDTLFPLLALTFALTLTAALIFALPARNRR